MKRKDRVNRPRWDSASIQALRRHMGYTQSEMAETLGTRQQTISEWETGMYQPRGASATLLSVVAERADFAYDVGLVVPKKRKKSNKLVKKKELKQVTNMLTMAKNILFPDSSDIK